MSAIPPRLPALQPPAPAPAARADFFRAALANVQASAQSGVQPVSVPTRPMSALAPAPAEDRPARPGALLDIRV